MRCAWGSKKPPHVYVEKVGINRGQIGNLPWVIDWCYDQWHSRSKSRSSIFWHQISAIIWEHFFELAMIGKLHFVSTVTTILILDLICNSNQHDHEILPVLKKSTSVWCHAQKLPMYGLATSLFYFVRTPFPREATKRHCHMPNRNFFMIHKIWWESFYPPPPSAIRGLMAFGT